MKTIYLIKRQAPGIIAAVLFAMVILFALNSCAPAKGLCSKNVNAYARAQAFR